MDWQVIPIAIVAVAAGCLYALYGYVDSGEPFNRQSFARSCKAAVLAGILFALGYRNVTIVPADYLLAFASGVGITAVGSKLAAK